VRPDPIASSVVALFDVQGEMLLVRDLDCMDGVTLINLTPYRTSATP